MHKPMSSVTHGYLIKREFKIKVSGDTSVLSQICRASVLKTTIKIQLIVIYPQLICKSMLKFMEILCNIKPIHLI